MEPRTNRGIWVTTLIHGQPEYADLLDQIRHDRDLVNAMWEDAESRPEELDLPGTHWSVATVDGVPAAWCAARVSASGELECHSNYEAPGYRGRALYFHAYRLRHRMVVRLHSGPAVTYLFAQPLAPHEADGWYRTGVTGTSHKAKEPHDWWELRRGAT